MSLRPAAQAARGVTYVFIQGVLSTLVSVVYFIVLARSFPPPGAELGVYALLSFLISLAQIVGSLSLSSATVKYMSQYMAQGHPEKARSVVIRVLQVSLLISVPLSTFLFVSAMFLSTQLLGTASWTPFFEGIAFVSFLAILHAQAISFLQGLQLIREFAAAGIVLALVQKALIIILIVMGVGFSGVIYGWFVGLLVSTVMALFLTSKKIGLFGKPHPFKPLITFSYPLYLSAILAFAANWVDSLLILPFMGTVYLGMYSSVAIPAATIPALVSTSIVVVLFPKLSELYSQYGSESIKEAFRFSTRYAVLVSFPLITVLAVLAEPIIVLFAGPAWREAAQPLTVLLLSTIPGTLGIAIGPAFMTLERTKVASMIAVTLIVIEVILAYVTLAYLSLGMIGAAFSRLIAGFITLTLGMYYLRKSIKVSFEWESIWKASVASVLMAITILTFKTIKINISQIFIFSIYAALGFAVYLFSLVALRAIKRYDMELLRDYLPEGLKWIATLVERIFLIK